MFPVGSSKPLERSQQKHTVAFLLRLKHNTGVGEQMANIASLLHSAPAWQSASALRLIQAEPKFPPLPLPLLEGVFENGLQRSSIAEISGQRSSGKTAVCLHV